MKHNTLAILAAAALQLLVSLSAALAQCSPKQYIDYGRAGLTDAQIQEKCKAIIPAWLAGQWMVTLTLKDFKVYDETEQQQGFNPFKSFAKTMESLTDLADKPEQQRSEIWLLGHKAGHLSMVRVYNPKYNPGSPLFAEQAGQQQSRHFLVNAGIGQGNRLELEVSSPPYGKEGIEQWQFTIDLNKAGNQKNQLSGFYRVKRRRQGDGKIIYHQGLVLMTRAR